MKLTNSDTAAAAVMHVAITILILFIHFSSLILHVFVTHDCIIDFIDPFVANIMYGINYN